MGIWLILLSIRWPVSYKNDGSWYNSTDAMDHFSFIDEMTLAQEVVLGFRYHRSDRPIRTELIGKVANG